MQKKAKSKKKSPLIISKKNEKFDAINFSMKNIFDGKCNHKYSIFLYNVYTRAEYEGILRHAMVPRKYTNVKRGRKKSLFRNILECLLFGVRLH